MKIIKALSIVSAIALAAGLAAPALAQQAPAGQQVSQTQDGYNAYDGYGGTIGVDGNAATIDAYAFEAASGNIAVNVSAGDTNQQVNESMVNNGAATYAFSGDYTQVSQGQVDFFDLANSASITDYAFEGASGVVTANAASGAYNQQANGVAVVSSGTLADDNVTAVQAGVLTYCIICGVNNLSGSELSGGISGNAFAAASGAVAANVAAGDMNQQLNQLSVGAYGGTDETALLQLTLVNGGFDIGGNDGTITDSAFALASGNIEANVAAGFGNQQANRAHVQGCSCGGSNDSAEQDSLFSNGDPTFGSDTGMIGGAAFYGASGQIGVNAAGGTVNQQGNIMSVSGNGN